MDDWTLTERVDRVLELAGEMDGLRFTRTGVNLEATFRWRIGEAMTGSVADMDNDDYRSFLAAWRQLVMRSKPTSCRRSSPCVGAI